MLTSRTTLQAEPWNVEGTTISGQGIEVSQYAGDYDHDDSQVGSRVLKEDEIAWSVLFRQASMKDIRVREMSRLPTTKAKTPLTFIEICFKYEGVPVSKDATRFKTVGPEEAEGMYSESFFLLSFCAANRLQLLDPSLRRERLLSCSELVCCFGNMT